jgi:glutathione-regulated potassium-efflux system ancillary protein KefG
MPNPKRILILFAHPRAGTSIVQSHMRAAISGLENVTIHDLYAAYPDFMIDVKREQALLMEHDVIIFQHPFYWYSSPAIIKEWQDLVLESGWAYGSGGTALHGKFLGSALSTGGTNDAYQEDGRNRFRIEDLLRPYDQTAYLCGMAYIAPFVIYSGRHIEEGQLSGHAEKYRDIVIGLRDGRINPLKHIADGHTLSPVFKAAYKEAQKGHKNAL